MRKLRILAVILVLAMAFSVFAFAADENPPPLPGSEGEAGPPPAGGEAPAEDPTAPEGEGDPAEAPPEGEGEAPPDMGDPGAMIPELDEVAVSAFFNDLDEGFWATKYIDNLAEKGLIKGDDQGNYNPKAAMKRCDFAVILCRQLEGKLAEDVVAGSYADVDPAAYYAEEVGILKGAGVLPEGDDFDPKGPVTRLEAAIWIYNAEKLKGMPDEFASDDVSAYADAPAIPAEYKSVVGTLTSIGVFQGDDQGNFNPDKELNRAEMAVLMYRMSCLGQGGPPPEGEEPPAEEAPAEEAPAEEVPDEEAPAAPPADGPGGPPPS